MNLDFSAYPELDGPIVLLFGCKQGTQEKLHLLYDAVIEANAQTVEVIDVRLANDQRWWILPFREDSMFQIFRRYTRKSYHTINKWRESDKFVQDVREFLAELVEQETSLEQLPANWPELVSLVILDGSLETNDSPYAQRVFDGWFPNAKFREYFNGLGTLAIWRDAEVASIESGRKPVKFDMLEWPISQLQSRLSNEALSLVEGVVPSGKVLGLVQLTREQLHAEGHFTDNVLDGIEEALKEHVLKLGMTSLEITAWFHAHNPSKASMAENVGCAG